MNTVAYSARYEGQGRNKLTVFFRYFMLIPLAFVAFFYAIGAFVSAIIAWFSIVFTGTYPQGAYDFNVRYLRLVARIGGYGNLLTDEYPPFNGDEDTNFPIRTLIQPAKPEYDRMKTLFRIFLLIPIGIISWVMGIIGGIAAIISWFAILFTDELPEGLYRPLRAVAAWQLRAAAYWLLLSEDFPPIWVEEEEEAPLFDGAGSVPALEADPYAAQADPYAAPQGDQGQEPPPPPPPPPAQ